MELIELFVDLLQQLASGFTGPTSVTFIAAITGWVLSHRCCYVTNVILSSSNARNGYWCRFHRFFSHAACEVDALSLRLAKLVVLILAPRTVLS
jgi:hypothetical protein